MRKKYQKPYKVKFIKEEDKLKYLPANLIELNDLTINYIKTIFGIQSDQIDAIYDYNNVSTDNFTTKIITQTLTVSIPFKNQLDLFIQPNFFIGSAAKVFGDKLKKSIGFYYTNNAFSDIKIQVDTQTEADFYKMIAANFFFKIYDNQNEVDDYTMKVKKSNMSYKTLLIAGKDDYLKQHDKDLLITNLISLENVISNTKDMKLFKNQLHLIEDDIFTAGRNKTTPAIFFEEDTRIMHLLDTTLVSNRKLQITDSLFNVYNMYKNNNLVKDNDEITPVCFVELQTSKGNKLELQVVLVYQVYQKIDEDNKTVHDLNKLVLRNKDDYLVNIFKKIVQTFYYLSPKELSELFLKDEAITLKNFNYKELSFIKTIKKSSNFANIVSILKNMAETFN